MATVAQPFSSAGIYVCPLFKNGKVLRVTVPRQVARALQVGQGDMVTFRLNAQGQMILEKLNVEAMKHAHLSKRATQLDLSAGGAIAPRDREGSS